MKEPTEVTKRIEARPSEGPFGEASIRSELMVCESWPMVMSLSCVWVPMHGCQTEAIGGLFLHKLYMSVSEAWQLNGSDIGYRASFIQDTARGMLPNGTLKPAE